MAKMRNFKDKKCDKIAEELLDIFFPHSYSEEKRDTLYN